MIKLTMPRGDIRNIKFSISDSTGVITDSFDEVYFTCKRGFTQQNYIFQKKLSDNTITFDAEGYYHLVITSEDTSDLTYGDYVFDIEIVNGTSLKQTTVGKLTITEEATFISNE